MCPQAEFHRPYPEYEVPPTDEAVAIPDWP